MDNTAVRKLSFDSAASELLIELEMVGQITNTTKIAIDFLPSLSSREEYYATRDQQLSLTIDYGKEKIHFISSSQVAIANSYLYLSYGVVALAWICFIVGLLMRRLSGLEALLVVQFSWLPILWFNVPLVLPLYKLWPLKYSTGYNHNFE